MGGRGSSSGKSKMSVSDQYILKRNEDYVKSMDKEIPEYIKSGMTSEEMQSAIVARIRAGSEKLSVTGMSIEASDIDGRFSAAKNSRYDELIRDMNATNFAGNKNVHFGRNGGGYYEGNLDMFFEERAKKITQKYSTKELREFVSSELGERIYRGGRPEYIRTISSSLQERFTDRGQGYQYLSRGKLSEISAKVPRFVSNLRQAVNTRDNALDKIAEIRGKYKRS